MTILLRRRYALTSYGVLAIMMILLLSCAANVVSGEIPLAKVDTSKRIKVPPPPPPPPKKAIAKTPASRDVDVTSVATETIAKSVFLDYLDNISHTFQDLVSGGVTKKEVLFMLLGIASIGLSCAAMVREDGLLIDILAWTCLIVGPSAAVLQRKVGLLEGMRELTNQLRDEVNEITASNAVLASQNKRLSKNTQKLQKTQSALEDISASQGISIDKLVDQVNEYKQIQADIKIDLRSKIQQTLLSVFMKSDRDEDFVIDPEEVNRLVFRLKSIPSVEFDEAKFRKALNKEGGDISKFADRYFTDDARMQKDAIFKY